MADSRTELILNAALAALAADGGPLGLIVNRSRKQPVPPEQLPMCSVYAATEAATLPGNNRHSPITDREFQFVVRHRAEGSDGDLDPLRQWTVKTLFASAELRALILDLREGTTEWASAEGTEAEYTVADTIFTVRHATHRNDLTRGVDG